MEFAQTIREEYNNYLLYLDGGYEPIRIPHSTPWHYFDLVHASNLFSCPLKSFKERSGATPIFPELAKRNNPTLMHRMQQGVRMAEVFQEAFYANKSHYNTVFTEHSVVDKTLKLQGRIDLYVEDQDSKKHIVEFKHRLPQWKTPFPQPRLGDVFQLFAYGLMTNADYLHLVIINTPQYRDYYQPEKGFEIWDLDPDLTSHPDKLGRMLISEHGYEWSHEQNTGDFINQNILEQEVERQLSYMRVNAPQDPPIQLGDDAAWQCVTKKRTAKNGVSGIVHAACPFFCHSESPKLEMEYTTGDNGEFILMENEEW